MNIERGLKKPVIAIFMQFMHRIHDALKSQQINQVIGSSKKDEENAGDGERAERIDRPKKSCSNNAGGVKEM